MNKMTSSFVIKLQSYIKSMFSNDVRFWLTLVGMIVGTVVFLAGFAVRDSFTKSYESIYEDWGEEALYISSYDEIDKASQIFFSDNLPNSVQTYYGEEHGYMESVDDYISYIRVGAVSANFVDNYQLSDNRNTLENHPVIEPKSYFVGEKWQENSTDREVIINEMAAHIYFRNYNPIGQFVTLDNYKYRVIGVISNSKYDYQNLKNLNQGESENVLPDGKIYMSFNCYRDNFHEAKVNKAMFKFENADTCRQSVTNMQGYYRTKIQNKEVSLSYVDAINLAIEHKLDDYSFVMMLLIVTILILSGFVIMNTIFFNVKEKITEIGVRKAFGASNANIMSQFVLEGVVYGFLSFIFGLVIGLLGIKLLSLFAVIGNIQYIITINISSVFICMVAVVAEGVIFSLAPAIYASKLKVVDSLKFE